MTRLEALILLSSVEGLGIQILRKMLEVFETPEAIVDCREAHPLCEKSGISLELAEKIVQACQSISTAQVLDQCRSQDVSLIHFLDPGYPKNLSAVYDPPILLYLKGRLLPEDDSALALVGSRRASAYGLQIAAKFAAELAEKGITIVSGLASGIDRASHEGALRARGRTLAVLGSGVDVVYPKENQKLYEAVVEQGAVLSEFPLGTEPRPYHFPKRNRIIAGLALGILVVEAGEKSGSLITARLGADEGREIYAVPGRIDNPFSLGTHRLIQEGAKLVTSSDQILEDLYPVLKGYSHNGGLPDAPAETECSNEEKALLDFLGTEPVSPDELAQKLELDSCRILQMLTALETRQKVKRLWGGTFVRSEVYLD